MNETVYIIGTDQVPVYLQSTELQWGMMGESVMLINHLKLLLHYSHQQAVRIYTPVLNEELQLRSRKHTHIRLTIKEYNATDLDGLDMLILATGNSILDQKFYLEAKQRNIMVCTPEAAYGDFRLIQKHQLTNFTAEPPAIHFPKGRSISSESDQRWKQITSKLIWAFLFMIIGHILISYLPLPTLDETWTGIKPYFNEQFVFFIIAGFLAQMVDGVLSMGYGVTSATCLMSFGVNPVAMSAAIHTSEIFTSGISGYSHYRFGNVNRKLFRHLVIPGVIGAVLGALMLVFIGEKYSSWLTPVVALYAGFLGLKILIKAFQKNRLTRKVTRLGWLAGTGGFLDSFGGGGWGPIVTSSLIARGRSPKYTVGSVSLTEFFVTMASAFTFFMTIGISHWNIVLGLLIGGGIAAPIAARLAGKLPRKTMMIAVGIMVMVWCVRMAIKSF